MVSSRVRPVKTRMVSCCSSGVSVAHDCTSLDSGTFSGSQKLLTRRFQTSTSLSSWMRFQLMASTWLSSLTFSIMSSPNKWGWFFVKAYAGGRAPAGVGVDDLLVADLVRVLVVLQVVVRQVRRRVVDAADLAFLADLNLGRHRVDRGGGVVDVGDRAGGRNGL